MDIVNKFFEKIIKNENWQIEINDKFITFKDKNNSSFRLEVVDYNYPSFVNIRRNKKYSYNQALLYVLNHALTTFIYKSEVVQYLKRITDHKVYLNPSSDNSKLKDENTCIFIDDDFSNSDFSLKDQRDSLLKYNIHASSETTVGDGVFVISKEELYKGIGYYYNPKGNMISIFEDKSNLPARIKSFILPNSVNIINPDINIFKDGDKNTKNLLVCFVPPAKERNISGELLSRPYVLDNILFSIHKREYYSETNLEEGIIYKSSKGLTLKNIKEISVIPRGFIEFKVLEKNPLYVKLEITYPLKESRVCSNTGIKGYSSKHDVGYIKLKSGNIIYPDIVAGPSSIKAKANTIKLAQASYVASNVYNYMEGTLDSFNVELIESLASEIEEGIWFDTMTNQEIPCYYGYVNLSFTDPSVQYIRSSYLSFPFEMLKLAQEEYPNLAELILDSRDSNEMNLVREIVYLQESLNGNISSGLSYKRYSSTNIPFSINRINSIEVLPLVNDLINEERPPFIYETRNKKKIYIPSGKSLLMFQNSSNGGYSYDPVLVQLSRVFTGMNDITPLINAVNKYVFHVGNSIVLSPKLYGINLKQVILYDKKMTIAIPTSVYKNAVLNIYGKDLKEDDQWKDIKLYAIAIRNPALWKNMFCIVNIIDGGNISTCKVSHDVVIRSRSDCDGDLMPIYFGNFEIQEELSKLIDNQFESTYLESKWEQLYYEKESDTSFLKDYPNSKYTLYTIPAVNYKNRLFDSAIAKGTVGVATVNYWIWSDIVNLYYTSYSGKEITLSSTKYRCRKLSHKIKDEIISLYACILQEAVIGAIKHMDNGSDSYSAFTLEELGKTTRWEDLFKKLYEFVPFLKLDSSDSYELKNIKVGIKTFFMEISVLFSSNRLDLFKQVNELHTFYNKGKPIEGNIDPILKEISFYKIVKIIDSWREEFKNLSISNDNNLISSKIQVLKDPF